MTDGQNFFDHPVRNNLITYDSIWKTATGQGDNYTTGCLLDYNHYDMIVIDLSKQQALDADPKAIQEINVTGKPDRGAGATMFFIIDEAK